MIWGYFGKEWMLDEKVSINGVNKTISINNGVTSLDIRGDVWSAWIRWVSLDENSRFSLAMRYSGLDAIPNGETGGIFFMINGWKLIIDLSNIQVSGVLYSENYPTPFYTNTLHPLYPATVSGIVLASTVKAEDLNVPTSLDIATAVWNAPDKHITGATASILTIEEQLKLNRVSTKQDVYNASML